MRISIFQLLLIAPTFLLAYLIAPFTDFSTARIYYIHTHVQNEIRSYRLQFEQELIQNPNFSLTPEYRKKLQNKNELPIKDLWRNDYQILEKNISTSSKFKSNIHVFSLGRDGISESNGNDTDDINSWTEDSAKYYREEINTDFIRDHFFRTMCVFPILYTLVLFTHYFWRSRKISKKSAAPTSAGVD